MKIMLKARWCLVNARYKLVLHDFTVAFPILPVFLCTSFEVTSTPMDEYGDEEYGIEVGNR